MVGSNFQGRFIQIRTHSLSFNYLYVLPFSRNYSVKERVLTSSNGYLLKTKKMGIEQVSYTGKIFNSKIQLESIVIITFKINNVC